MANRESSAAQFVIEIRGLPGWLWSRMLERHFDRGVQKSGRLPDRGGLQNLRYMKPYYEHAGITIYHGDCREVLPTVRDGWYDLAFADPPYGVNKAAWDAEYPEGFELELCRVAAVVAITPGMWALGRCIHNLADKYKGVVAARNLNGVTFGPMGYANWIPTVIAGAPRSGMDSFEYTFDFTVDGIKPEHPSPKPINFMRWIVRRFCPDDGLMIDPYMDSGTSLEAAKLLGRQAIGIEIEEKYCEIAAKRLSQEVFDFK